MGRTVLLRTVVVAVVSVALGVATQASFAQRGTHGMGGGFHVGGGGFHHGGNGFSGFGGGFYGGPRGFWGYAGYGYGVSVGFGFGPYWGAYPYWYGYGPWWGPSSYYPYNPYYYPDTTDPSYPPDCRNSPDYRHDDAPPSSSNPDGGDNAPAEPSSTPTPEAFPDPDTVTTYSVAYRPIISRVRPDPTDAVQNNYKLAGSSARLPSSGLRPALRNAIQALRAMPPWAQQRWLRSGRYDNFTPQERKLLKDALRLPQAE